MKPFIYLLFSLLCTFFVLESKEDSTNNQELYNYSIDVLQTFKDTLDLRHLGKKEPPLPAGQSDKEILEELRQRNLKIIDQLQTAEQRLQPWLKSDNAAISTNTQTLISGINDLIYIYKNVETLSDEEFKKNLDQSTNEIFTSGVRLTSIISNFKGNNQPKDSIVIYLNEQQQKQLVDYINNTFKDALEYQKTCASEQGKKCILPAELWAVIFLKSFLLEKTFSPDS